MKKLFLIILTTTLFSFTVNEEKKLKFEFTTEEVNLIYTALGKLPAEQVEGLRQKIVIEFKKQTADTTKKK